MIIVNFNSQLGNQMFQYAIYRKLQLQGKHVKADMRYYANHPQHNALGIFDISLDVASEKEIHIERDEYRTYLDRFRRKVFGKRQNIVSEIEKKSYDYESRIFELKRGYIDGYWQSEKYFEDIENVIRKDFTFPPLNDAANIAFKDRIENSVSVSIHVRRGDYVGIFPLLDMDYYQSAMDYFRGRYKQVHFFVFSNDLGWCREHFTTGDVSFVDVNTGKDSYKDMQLMSLCNHNIIANSSFSWWGAWLNVHKDKEVIAPDVWLYHAKTPIIYCKNWKIFPEIKD